MLAHLTWHQYLITCGTLLLCYYTAVVLLFYRQDLSTLWKRGLRPNKARTPATLPPILGAVQDRPQEELTETARLQVAPSPARDLRADTDTPPPEVMPDLLQELHALLDMVTQHPAGKEELLGLLRLLTAKYGPILPGHLKDQVNRLLLERTQPPFPMPLTAVDLPSLWQAATQAKSDLSSSPTVSYPLNHETE